MCVPERCRTAASPGTILGGYEDRASKEAPVSPDQLFAIFALLLGMCIGSFLNVVAIRIPAGGSIVSPPSACPACGSAIRWHDNIPVLGYLLLGAKGRSCGGRISWRYPACEAATGLLFLGIALKTGFSAAFVPDAILVSLLMVTVRTDLEHWIVLDEISLGGTVAGLLISLVPGGLEPLGSLGASAGAFLLFLLIRQASLLALRRKPGYVVPPEGCEDDGEGFTGGMGWGDIKLAACIGAFLGPASTIVALFLAFGSGAVTGLVLMAFGRSRRVPIPFGPFMAAGAMAAVFAGEALFRAYADARWP